MTEALLSMLKPEERIRVMEDVARAYLTGTPISEFCHERPDFPIPHYHIYLLYKKCFAVDGDNAPRCKYCSDKRVAHRGKCRTPMRKNGFRTTYAKMITEVPTEHVEANCPCCGSGIDREALAIDINNNMMCYRGRSWKIQPQLAIFAHTVKEAWPKSVSSNDLQFALWGAQDGPDGAANILKQYASRFRSVVHNTGIELRRGPRPGSYQLWLPPGTTLINGEHNDTVQKSAIAV